MVKSRILHQGMVYRQARSEQNRKFRYAGYLPREGTGSLTHRRTTKTILHNYILLFSDDPDRNRHYGPHIWTLRTELPEVHDELIHFTMDYYEIEYEEAQELVDSPDIVNDAGAWEDPQFTYEVWERFEEPGYRTYDGAVVLDREGVEMVYSYEDEDAD